MERQQLGPSAVPAIGQGTWQMEQQRQRSIRALRCGLDLGLTHVDTAEMYGAGEVEALVGEAIAGRRDEVFLVSKVLPHNAHRSGAVRACEASLRRLGTDHLDLYLLHWPGPHPLEQTLEAFEALERDGKIRAWGVSNFDVAELDRAHALAGPGRIACNQVLYHLGQRHIEHAVIPWCAAHDVPVVAYSPFGSGRFPPSGPGDRVLAELAAARGVSAQQLALGFVLRVPGLLAIPKAGRRAHVEDNAAAGELELTAQELRALEGAFPVGRPGGGLPMI